MLMNVRTQWIVGGVVGTIACTVAGLVFFQQPAAVESAQEASPEVPLSTPGPGPGPGGNPVSAAKVPPPQGVPHPAGNDPALSPREPTRPTQPIPRPQSARLEPALRYNGYEVQDPLARVALYWVGEDLEATEYWMAAINDPNLPAGERKDLIEDLNEDGLFDPRHPTADDLPLIQNRIDLIETIAPSSMDQANAAAFAEAYKDLVGLLEGRPPQ